MTRKDFIWETVAVVLVVLAGLFTTDNPIPRLMVVVAYALRLIVPPAHTFLAAPEVKSFGEFAVQNRTPSKVRKTVAFIVLGIRALSYLASLIGFIWCAVLLILS